MDFTDLMERKAARLSELEEQMSAPTFYEDARAAGTVMQEHKRTKELLETWATYRELERQLAENEELARGDDEEMAALAADELPSLRERVEDLRLQMQYALLPRDLTEDRDAFVEIRAGTGGDEASLFAGDLMRMYQRYAEERGWKVEPVEASESEVGGYKEVVFKVVGDEVFRYLKYESGVHRVQRVPATETQGRIHTYTATVAVMPEAEDVDVELKPEDLTGWAAREYHRFRRAGDAFAHGHHGQVPGRAQSAQEQGEGPHDSPLQTLGSQTAGRGRQVFGTPAEPDREWGTGREDSHL